MIESRHFGLRVMRKPGSPAMRVIWLLGLLWSTTTVQADEVALNALLQNFLANVTAAETHDRFWAEDLIYTSSRGTRSTKAEVMAGFDAAPSADDVPGPSYAAEDVQIQVYGDMAIVAFRLVATPPGSSERQEYFNTGTFLFRNQEWRAVAWQATIIPGTIIRTQ